MRSFFKALGTVVGYKYGIFKSQKPEDEFVAEALKMYDPTLYQELEPYNKQGANVYEVNEQLREVCGEDRSGVMEITELEASSLEYACDKVAYMFRDVKVEPLSITDAVGHLHAETSAGFGYRGKKKGDVVPEIMAQARKMMFDVVDGKQAECLPTTVGTRGALHHYKNKKRRLIYVFPAAVQTLEQCFVAPILGKLKEQDGLLFFGQDVLPRLREMMMETHAKGTYAIRVDFSQFDRSIRVPILDVAFDIIERMIDFENWEGKPQSFSQQRRWRKLYAALREYFLNTPVMGPDGELFNLIGGIVSGSGFTQLVGSIVTAIYLETAAHYHGVGTDKLKTLGDDGYFIASQKPDLERWSVLLKRMFNATLSEEKTEIFDASKPDKRFLGYRFKQGFLHRPSFEWFNLLLHPEQEVKDLSVSYSRFIAYMFLGGINDVKFCNFFEYMQSGFELPDVLLTITKDMKRQIQYAGLQLEIKFLREYKARDFVWDLILRKIH